MYRLFLLLAKDLLVPAGLYFWQSRGKYTKIVDAILMSLLSGVYTIFVYETADWAIYGYYWRYLLPIFWLTATISQVISIRKKNHPESGIVAKNRLRFGRFFISAISFLFAVFAIWAVSGNFQSGTSVSLSFPLKDGQYYILEGGDSPLINTTHHALPPVPQKYALDIIAIGEFGKRSVGFFPESPDEYYVFGKSVFSPIDGIVTAVVDQYVDSLSAGPKMDENEAYGNRIIIQNDSLEIMLAQLKQGSISVRLGDTIFSGQQIAAVGCSGDVSEPHLHIQATIPATDARVRQYWDRSGIPMQFSGRFLVKNDIFEASN